jgi:hypothetical protein
VSRPAPSWNAEERDALRALRRPEDVQRFVDDLPYNKEVDGETCRSPRRVLGDRTAQCFEAAVFAASAFRFHGRPPLVLLLAAVRDEHHLLALYRERKDGGAWGAVGKSKFVGLRFRDPVYRTPRELAMSYFESYYNDEAEKTLRAISRPIDLARVDARGWEHADGDIWGVSEWIGLHAVRPLVTPSQARRLRRVEPVAFAQGLLPGQTHPPREKPPSPGKPPR